MSAKDAKETQRTEKKVPAPRPSTSTISDALKRGRKAEKRASALFDELFNFKSPDEVYNEMANKSHASYRHGVMWTEQDPRVIREIKTGYRGYSYARELEARVVDGTGNTATKKKKLSGAAKRKSRKEKAALRRFAASSVSMSAYASAAASSKN